MRIVGGQFRGRALATPGDDRTRPTSDRVREAVFNILAHGIADFSLEGVRVLDLFAGTGALGLEALSRGAAYCLFVEEDAERAASSAATSKRSASPASPRSSAAMPPTSALPATAAASASSSSIRPTARASPSARSPPPQPAAGWRRRRRRHRGAQGRRHRLPAGFTALDRAPGAIRRCVFARYTAVPS